MNRARRLSQRLLRWTSLCVCFALILSALALFPFQVTTGRNAKFKSSRQSTQGSSPSGQGRRVAAPQPQPGPPAANLPNLDDVRRRKPAPPRAQQYIPSSVRSRRNPLVPRNGRKVGDPWPIASQPSAVSNQPNVARASSRARISATRSSERFNHGIRSAMPTPTADDQYVQNFYQWALLRAPSSTELTYWDDMLRVAYAHGQGSVVIAARELGKTLFESSDYAARARADRDYVYDLYKTFLMRDPDQTGWDNWTATVPTYGRDQVRRGFDESTEFQNLMATITPDGGVTSAVSSLPAARVDPNNQPGSGLLGRPAEWGVGLLSLPGRSGLDLGLGLSYSSARVWTRSGAADRPYLYFDEDNGTPSPGFRLGFPTVQELSFDAQAGVNVYLLITPSGHRVELRQMGTSNVYEAADSSYLQLIYNGNLLVRSTDGTRLTYTWFNNNEYRCTEIKDRNGNYLTVNYVWTGQISSITDTLGRVITFNYDGNQNLTSITQPWNGATHYWATFGWTSISVSPGFSSNVSVSGAPYNVQIPALSQVSLDDGSYFTFTYSSTGQINFIGRHTSDGVQRSYTAYNYDAVTSACPRISATRVWAENWAGLNGVPSEIVTQYTLPGDGSHQMTAPDGTTYKEFYGSGWQDGLVTQTQFWGKSDPNSALLEQKWTTTSYTQDNTGVNYQTNPRVTETNIYDAAGNRSRSTINYTTFTLPSGASCSLPGDSYQYAADAATVLRRSHTDYNLSSTYLNQRIIGLPASQLLYDGSNNLMAWTDLQYDENGSVQNQGSTTQHDDTNYGASFLAGRANLSSSRRYDVSNMYYSTVSSVVYNTSGSAVMSNDPLGHQASISYADSFSDSVNRSTFAYPTTVTDPDGYSSTIQYNFDFGAKTQAQGPPPAGQSQGVIQTFTYDSAARIQQVTTANTGAYTRYVYGPTFVATFATINNIADETYSIQYVDGLGGPIAAAGNHPGSAGGYKAQLTVYDQMGRAVQQTNPTEISGSWIPSGDDAAGLQFNNPTLYDWKGRPLKTYNMDGSYKEASYSACGCAGGEVVTLTDEMGRHQRVTSDSLARQWKREALNWDSSVYSTTENTFNARDQVTQVRQYQGNDQSSVFQDTAISYDGYGRLQAKHVPEQNAGTATTYAYNADDTVYSITDARGASATYSYNNRHLVAGITYSAPAGITATSNVSFGYDAVGNRTSMTDGLGSKSYSYNQLSQITSEGRTFTGVGTYTLGYNYNLAGEPTGITDPFNATINYAYDSTGRLSAVTGTSFGGVSTYASNMQYRAFNAVKSLSYGNSKTLSVGYDNRLAVSSYEVPGVLKKSYQRNNDGSLQFTQDQLISNSKFDRSYTYDHAGRIATALSGAEARGQGATNDRPYNETFTYDAMGHLTSHDIYNWDQFNPMGTQTFTNNRNSGWSYDADGRLISGSTGSYVYDAGGSVVSFGDGDPNMTDQLFDGDGQRVKSIQRRYDDATSQWITESTTYYVNSTVLGGVLVSELTATGGKQRTFVYAGSSVLAEQSVFGSSQSVAWEHRDPSGASVRGTDASGQGAGEVAELDPLGANAGLFKPFTWPPPDSTGKLVPFRGFEDMDLAGGGCTLDGMPIPCGIFNDLMRAGAVANEALVRNPNGTWVRHQNVVQDHGVGVFTLYTYEIDKFGEPADQRRFAHAVNPQNTAGAATGAAAIRAAGLLRNNNCSNFIAELISIAASVAGQPWRGEITPSFGPLQNQNGTPTPSYNKYYALNEYERALAGGRVTASGEPGTKGDTITYGETTANSTISWNKEFYSLSLNDQALMTLHESLHLIPNFSDFVVAGAAHIMATRGLNDPGNTGSFKDKSAASKYINEQIAAHCRP